MRPGADDLDHLADGSLGDQFFGIDRGLYVKPLAIVDGELAPVSATAFRQAATSSRVVRAGLSQK
jgi:hypothetical protein